MTATADATDSNIVEQQTDRIQQLETELTEHKNHTGREFAEMCARITKAKNRQKGSDSKDATLEVDKKEAGAQTP